MIELAGFLLIAAGTYEIAGVGWALVAVALILMLAGMAVSDDRSGR